MELSRTGLRFPAASSCSSVCVPSRACRTTESTSTPSTCSERRQQHLLPLKEEQRLKPSAPVCSDTDEATELGEAVETGRQTRSTGCLTFEAFQGGGEETLTQEFCGAAFRGNKLVPAGRERVVISSSGSASSLLVALCGQVRLELSSCCFTFCVA